MQKKMMSVALAAFITLSAYAMITGLTYQKVSDKDCNKCSITNEGATRKCGQCEKGFLVGGKAELADNGWLKATFTCNKCGHQSVWKYKNK